MNHDKLFVKKMTTGMLNQLQKEYPNVKAETGGEALNVDALSNDEVGRLRLDLLFFEMNPLLPPDLLCAQLHNYLPENKSQEELLYWANELVQYDQRTPAGLFISGSNGVGKSHVAVGIAKELAGQGFSFDYLSLTGTVSKVFFDLGRSTKNMLILDECPNSPTGFRDPIAQMIDRVHQQGGRLIITSNNPYNDFRNELNDVGPYYVDRADGMLREVQVDGESHRKRKAWYVGKKPKGI